jgi:two-component system response regulator
MTPKTILLVEDNISDIALTRRAIEKNGIACRVDIVEDGQEALDYLLATGAHAGRDLNEQPALVLLDLKLPRIDGLDVLRRIRADPRTRRIPVVMLTSSREESDMGAGYDLGMNSYIRKPVDFVQFMEVIRQIGLYWLAINEPPPR